MKKLLILTTALFIINDSLASVVVTNPLPNASEIYFLVDKTGLRISLYDLSKIKIKDYEKLTGKKMNFFKRLGFSITQIQLRKSINKDGYFSNKKSEKYFTKAIDGQKGFHLGGFALGLFLGPFFGVGILIAYLIKDDKKKNRVKWAWIGFASWIIILLILFGVGVLEVGIGL